MATRFDELQKQLTKQDEEWAAAMERMHGLPASFAVPSHLLRELDDAFSAPAPPIASTALPIGIRA